MKYFYERFDGDTCTDPLLQKITTQTSISQFTPRNKGLKFLIINPPIREWSYPNIVPIGHCYIASSVIVDGHRVDVLDLNAERKEPVYDLSIFNSWVKTRIREKLNESKPDIIGIGGIVTQYTHIKELTTLCKDINPDIPIILGGGIASCMPNFMMKYLPVDIVATEECEVTISEVLYRIELKYSLRGVKGILYREKDEIVNNGKRKIIKSFENGLDCLNWPARSYWDVEDIYKKNPIGHLNWESKWKGGKPQEKNKYCLSMLASRGCPYSCDYCYVTYLGDAYRLRSPKDIVDEMEYIKNKYDLSYIHFLDDLFMANYKWSLSFFKELRNRRKKTGFEIMWGATCRTNIIADDIIRAQKQNRDNLLKQGYDVGLRQACFGIESASPTILKNIDKSGQTLKKIAMAAHETKRVLGYIDPSFMIGSPGETEQTIRETVTFCKKHDIDVETIFYTTAFPGTPFWNLALDKGLIGKAVKGYNCKATDDIVEQYLMRLGENSEAVRTNFSDELSDRELIDLGNWATEELGSKNRRHPHTGEIQMKAVGAAKADL